MGIRAPEGVGHNELDPVTGTPRAKIIDNLAEVTDDHCCRAMDSLLDPRSQPSADALQRPSITASVRGKLVR